LANAEGVKTENVIWLLRTANKGLPELANRYYKFKTEVGLLESKRQSQVRAIQDYTSQLTDRRGLLNLAALCICSRQIYNNRLLYHSRFQPLTMDLWTSIFTTTTSATSAT
jgi:hypothetical protein